MIGAEGSESGEGEGGVRVISEAAAKRLDSRDARQGAVDLPGVPDTCPETAEADPERLARIEARMRKAAERAARELVARGIASEAWAEGTTIHARIGRYHCTVINRVTPGPPGLTERVRSRYAAMVMQALLEGRLPTKP